VDRDLVVRAQRGDRDAYEAGARDSAALEAWLPVADEFVESIHFLDG
jgi:hypothetical protein